MIRVTGVEGCICRVCQVGVFELRHLATCVIAFIQKGSEDRTHRWRFAVANVPTVIRTLVRVALEVLRRLLHLGKMRACPCACLVHERQLDLSLVGSETKLKGWWRFAAPGLHGFLSPAPGLASARTGAGDHQAH